MLGKMLTSFVNINNLGWFILAISVLMIVVVVFWALAIVELPMIQFMFIVIFPLLFIVVIPVIAYFMFLHSGKHSN